jgi:hypothetical protein
MTNERLNDPTELSPMMNDLLGLSSYLLAFAAHGVSLSQNPNPDPNQNPNRVPIQIVHDL